MRIPSGKVDQLIYFVALDSTDRVTRKTGLSSFTVYRSRNGGAATAYTTPTVAELSSSNMPGLYALTVDEDTTIASTSDSEEYCVHITCATMAPVSRTIELYRRGVTSGKTLTVDGNSRADASVGAVAAGVIAAASFAANALDAVWSTATRVLTAGTNIVLAKGTGVTGFNDLDAAGVRSAAGLASANLDTQLGAIAGYIDTEVAAIKAKTDQLTFTVASQVDVNVVDWKGATAPAMSGDAYARIGAAGAGLTALGDARIAHLDADISSRSTYAGGAVASVTGNVGGNVVGSVGSVAGLTAADVAAIKAKTDNLPASPAAVGSAMTLTVAYDAAKTAASQTSVDDLPTNTELATALAGADDATLAAIAALNNLSAAQVNAEVDTALADVGLTTTITGRIDAAITSRLASAGYTAPDNALIAAIDAKTTNLPSDPADQSLVIAATTAIYGRIGAPAGASIAADIAGVSTGSGPTATEIADEVQARTLNADIKKVNGVTVAGLGTSGSPWGPV
jgi:hypothetical protein